MPTAIANGHINDIPPHGKFFEFLKHFPTPFRVAGFIGNNAPL
jgi:hypothetical protein